MPSEPEERLDRRDFMIASIATAGASAALAVTAGAANAQGAATTSADPASATVYTGEVDRSFRHALRRMDGTALSPSGARG
jgi:nitrous oxide reductase